LVGDVALIWRRTPSDLLLGRHLLTSHLGANLRRLRLGHPDGLDQRFVDDGELDQLSTLGTRRASWTSSTYAPLRRLDLQAPADDQVTRIDKSTI
jgi:hypothetical protein